MANSHLSYTSYFKLSFIGGLFVFPRVHFSQQKRRTIGERDHGDVALSLVSIASLHVLSHHRVLGLSVSCSCSSPTGSRLSPALGQSPVMLLSPSDLSRRCLSVDSFLSYHPGWPSLQPQPNNFCYPFVYAVAPTGRPSCARAVLGSGLVAGIALGAASILMVFLAYCRCRCGLYAGREWLDYLSQQATPELNQLLVCQGCRIDFGVQTIQ